MSDVPFEIEYNRELGRLTELLASVDRGGGYVCSGTWTGPLPRVDVERVGTLAFPLLDVQGGVLSAAAQAAPYGRGEETVYDPSVRNTRQIPAEQVRLSGKNWRRTLEEILEEVRTGLGCIDVPVVAELYKMLLYEEGGFFAPHRDTEKAEGMFATLVLALPSFHEGGDLIVRHGEDEARISFSTDDVSEIRYAAFYADCEHEVLPVTKGNRLCLVYNLVHRPAGETAPGELAAPDYGQEVEQVAAELGRWKSGEDRAAKIAWLLDHAYTPAGLSFRGLKHVDAARASVLQRAAERSGCALHLGIVHIEESGPAEIEYSGYGRQGRYGYDDEIEVDEEYEIIEISDWEHRVTDWRTTDDRSVDFGELPLLEGELLPAGALDEEPPDDERVTEATGNEGASFERSYHRAALLVWDEAQTSSVLLHAGTAAAVAYLRELAGHTDLSCRKERDRLLAAVSKVVERWEDAGARSWRRPPCGTGMAGMLEILARLGDVGQIRAFIGAIVVEAYERGVNEALIACLDHLNSGQAKALTSAVMVSKAETHPVECIDLLRRMAATQRSAQTIRDVAGTLIEALPDKKAGPAHDDWMTEENARPVRLTGACIADLFSALWKTDSPALVSSALAKLADHPKVYPPDGMLFPAVKDLGKRLRCATESDEAYAGLWRIVADFLADRSADPPQAPRDWKQPVPSGCRCNDCKDLMRFAADPVAQVGRFALRKDRRQHLHQRIEGARMDMTHETERKGRPYTLVCIKTRRSYERRLTEYARDVEQMTFLTRHVPSGEEARKKQLQSALHSSKNPDHE